MTIHGKRGEEKEREREDDFSPSSSPVKLAHPAVDSSELCLLKAYDES